MNFKIKFFLINLFFISGCTGYACGSNDDKSQPQPAVEIPQNNCDCNHCDQSLDQ